MTAVLRRMVMIGSVVIAAVAAALAFEAMLSIDAASPFGLTRYGHAVGWSGLAVILHTPSTGGPFHQSGHMARCLTCHETGR